jgi:hypothetical protein
MKRRRTAHPRHQLCLKLTFPLVRFSGLTMEVEGGFVDSPNLYPVALFISGRNRVAVIPQEFDFVIVRSKLSDLYFSSNDYVGDTEPIETRINTEPVRSLCLCWSAVDILRHQTRLRLSLQPSLNVRVNLGHISHSVQICQVHRLLQKTGG